MSRNDRLIGTFAICIVCATLSSASLRGTAEQFNKCQKLDLINIVRIVYSHGINQCPLQDVPQSTLSTARHYFTADRIEARNEELTRYFNGRLPGFMNDWLKEDTDYFEKVDIVRTYLHDIETFHQKNTVAQVGLSGMYAQIHSTEYSFMYMHLYENYHDLMQAAGPQVDQELCIKQMVDLKGRIEKANKEKYASKDIQLHQLMDTYGRNPAGLLQGNIFWEGLYTECNNLKLEYSYENWTKQHDTRYCVVKFRPYGWRDFIDNEIVALRIGACLPRACDSLNYKNKYDLLIDLYNFNARAIDFGAAQVTGVYCLPDKESPMRSIWHSKVTATAIVAATCWICLLVFATIKYHRFYKAKEQSGRASPEPNSDTGQLIQVYKSLSITNNLSLLFDTEATSSLVQAGEQLKDTIVLNDNKKDPSAKYVVERAKSHTNSKENALLNKVLDLRALEGIKTVAMFYVIFGHTLMCSTSGMIDGRKVIENPLYTVGNMIPAFTVNTFFCITGILTCYLMFKQNEAYPFMTQPTKWIAFVVYRYLRIMPMYLLAVLYSKYIAKYTNDGPIWDYGTSSLSQRRICEQESWLWTLLFGANFKKPLDHCIPGGWYLANDMQFFIVTPFFLALLYKNAEWGKKILTSCIVVCYIASMVCIFQSGIDDFTPIAQFDPHGFKTYVTNLHYNYTRPYYRIPAYLFGLYIGFVLYNFEKDKLRFFELRNKKVDCNNNNDNNNNNNDQQINDGDDIGEEPDFPEAFKKYCTPVCAVLVFLCLMTPVIASFLPFNKIGARIMTSFICPSYHLAFSIVIGLFVLANSTSKSSNLLTRILAAPQWKPLSRLSLCVLLVNIEVVIYIMQGRKVLHAYSIDYLLSLTLLVGIFTYLAATVVCILFEAPLRAALNHVLKFALKKMKESLRRSNLMIKPESPHRKVDNCAAG